MHSLDHKNGINMKLIILTILTLIFAYFVKPLSVGSYCAGTYNTSLDTLSGGLLIIDSLISESPYANIIYDKETHEFKEVGWFAEDVIDDERIDELNEESNLIKLVNYINENLKFETKHKYTRKN